jgi:DNA replication protein DnaC
MTTPTNSLPAQLEQIGLHVLAAGVDDFLARATKQRWSPRQILEQLAQTEAAERAHRSLERRLRLSEIRKLSPWRTSTGPGGLKSNAMSLNVR